MPALESTQAASDSTRRTPIALLVAAAILLAARVAVTTWEARHPSHGGNLVAWVELARAETEARATGRPMLHVFSAAWCGPCRRLEADVLGDRGAATFINETFVPVHVMDRTREDGENIPEVASLVERFGVVAFPTVVVSSPDGGKTVVLRGYPGRDEFLGRLREAAAR